MAQGLDQKNAVGFFSGLFLCEFRKENCHNTNILIIQSDKHVKTEERWRLHRGKGKGGVRSQGNFWILK